LLLLATDKAITAANRSRTLGDMQAITSAMSAYLSDFSDIPRTTTGMGGWDKYADTGAYTLAQALLGPAPMATDGHDGFGFSLRAGGRVYGPYLPPDRFHVKQYGATSGQTSTIENFEILDRFGHGIQYLPSSARFTAAQLQYVAPTSGTYVPVYIGNSVVNDSGGAIAYPQIEVDSATGYTDVYMFEFGMVSNSFGNGVQEQNQIALNKLRAMFGDFDYNGGINSVTYPGGRVIQETAFYTGRYVLYSAGPDGLFGPDTTRTPPAPYTPSDVANCDDIILNVDW
jgi:hypothetical protein